MSSVRFKFGLGILLLLLLGSIASATTGVVVTGEATAKAAVVSRVEAWLSEHGHEVMKTAPLPQDAMSSLDSCLQKGDEPCARKVFERGTTPASLIYVRVARKDGTKRADNTLEIVGYWFDRNRNPVASRHYCERCSEQSLRSQVDAMMTSLSSSRILDTGTVRATSRPAGAKLAIDGTVVGVTPLDQVLPVGRHEVTMTIDGKQPEVREVLIRAGETTTVDVPFDSPPLPDSNKVVPDPQPDRKPDPHVDQPTGSGKSYLVPGVVLGVGAVAVIGGVALSLSTDPPESGVQPEKLYSGPGIGIAIAGGAAIGVGGYLLWRAMRTPSTRTSAPTVSVTPQGATVGWVGSF